MREDSLVLEEEMLRDASNVWTLMQYIVGSGNLERSF